MDTQGTELCSMTDRVYFVYDSFKIEMARLGMPFHNKYQHSKHC